MSFVLTLVAPPGQLDPALVAAVQRAVASGPAVELSAGEAVDLPCPAPPDDAALRAAIGTAPVDAVVTQAANRRKRLLIADMDSTIVQGETLDDLAARAGVGDRVAAITARSMAGELDFAAALRERVALLEGLNVAALEDTWAATALTPGARELVATMRAHGARTALVSGGFTFFTGRVADALGFDEHRANTLLSDGARLLGRVGTPILDRAAKLEALQELAALDDLATDDCLAVGDGANDLDMIRAAGLGVAFHAKPIVAAAARARIDHTSLRTLLFIQGYRADEFVRADPAWDEFIAALEPLARAFARYEQELGQSPILVGGAAATIYSEGAFPSGDFDVVASVTGAFDRAMLAEGFIRENRKGVLQIGFYHSDHPRFGYQQVSGRLFDGMSDSGRLVRVQLNSVVAGVTMPSIEDLIADRLAQYAAGPPNDTSRLDQARGLLKLAGDVDMPYLLKRIADEGGDPAFLDLTHAKSNGS